MLTDTKLREQSLSPLLIISPLGLNNVQNPSIGVQSILAKLATVRFLTVCVASVGSVCKKKILYKLFRGNKIIDQSLLITIALA